MNILNDHNYSFKEDADNYSFKNLMDEKIGNIEGRKDITCKELLNCVDRKKTWLGKVVSRVWYAAQGKGYINEERSKKILESLSTKKLFELQAKANIVYTAVHLPKPKLPFFVTMPSACSKIARLESVIMKVRKDYPQEKGSYIS